ncbi:hypothetical protein [Priestia abyssalis]|nr:hypothetical protein [Priestia abyssalis]
MIVALLIWLFVIIFGLALGTYLCMKIEKSKVKRWGASGKLFR